MVHAINFWTLHTNALPMRSQKHPLPKTPL
jgi:hypothetical protein